MRKIKFVMALALFVGAMLATSCGKDDDEKSQYSITVTSADTEKGTVTGSGTFDEGTEIEIYATALTGYYFSKWSDGNTDNPRKITVTQNLALTAEFGVTGDGGGQGGGTSTDPQSIEAGTINGNTVWKDLGLPIDYIIKGNIALEGNALVTIEAGVTIMFSGNDGGISVGENAGLKIAGTKDKPVVITGPANNQNIGSWRGITIESKRSDNVFEYCTFKNGGSRDGKWDGVIDVEGGTVAIKNCVIDGSFSNGIQLESGAKLSAFENNEIANCKLYPVYIEEFESVLSLTNDNNTYAPSNIYNMIGVDDGHIESSDKNTLKQIPVPYYFLNGLDLIGSQTFTIEAGATLKFGADKRLNISENVTFVAQGTKTSHITFDGYESESGYWRGVYYESQKSGSAISYCDFKNGGKGESDDWTSALICINDNSSKGSISNCTFTGSENYGIVIYDNSATSVTIEGDTYTDCAQGNIVHWTFNHHEVYDNYEVLKLAAMN